MSRFFRKLFAAAPAGRAPAARTRLGLECFEDRLVPSAAPVPTTPMVQTVEDTPVLLRLTATDEDPGDTQTFSVVFPTYLGDLYQVAGDNVTSGAKVQFGTNPNGIPDRSYISVTNPEGWLKYVPKPDANDTSTGGSDEFLYCVTDGTGLRRLGIVSVTVAAVNDSPVARPNIVYGENNLPWATWYPNVSDVDRDELTIRVTDLPNRGTLYYVTDGVRSEVVAGKSYPATGTGSFAFVTENPFEWGESYAEFSYQAEDPAGLMSAPVTSVVNIAYVNRPPTPTGPTSFAGQEDTTLDGIRLTATDPDGHHPEFDLTALPAHGKLYVVSEADGKAYDLSQYSLLEYSRFASGPQPTLRYVPDADFNGPDTFRYRVSDGIDATAEITVTLNIAAVNDAPTITGPANVGVVLGAQGKVAQAATLTGLTLADDSREVAGAIVDVTITAERTVMRGGALRAMVAGGQINVAAFRGVTVTRLSDGEVRLSGTLVAIQVALNNGAVTYTPDGATIGQAGTTRATKLKVVLSDRGTVRALPPGPALTAMHYLDVLYTDAPAV